MAARNNVNTSNPFNGEGRAGLWPTLARVELKITDPETGAEKN